MRIFVSNVGSSSLKFGLFEDDGGKPVRVAGMFPAEFDWLAEQGLDRLPEFLIALAIGLLIGLERERNPTAKGGLRTFAIIALAGAAAATLSEALAAPSIVAVGLAAVAFTMIAAYYHHHEEWHERDPGTTTIVAAVACYLLAAVALSGSPRLAVMLSVVITLLLYFKAELGGFARALERRDVISILQFAVVAFIALPLLPNRELGPYAALNPHHIWLMVVLISGVSLAGFIALRVVGREHGAVLLGLFGGLVSSTATTLAYARYARAESGSSGLSVTVILTANLALLLRLAVLAAIVAPRVLVVFAPVLGTALVAGLAAYALTRGRGSGHSQLTMPPINNPAELPTALGFAVLYASVLLLVAWLADLAGNKGIYAAAFVSGLTDVDAITLSSLRMFGLGAFSAGQVTTAIALAVFANTVFKSGIVLAVGGRGLFHRCAPTLTAVVAGAGVGVALFT